MKKFFAIAFLLIISTGIHAQAQIQQPWAIGVDSIDIVLLSSEGGKQKIKDICIADPNAVLNSPSTKKKVLKKKEKSQYVYYYSNGTTSILVPAKGETLLSYEGKYFYSFTAKAFVQKASAVYGSTDTEKKTRSRETLTAIANSPAGQTVIAAGNEIIRRGVVKILNPQ